MTHAGQELAPGYAFFFRSRVYNLYPAFVAPLLLLLIFSLFFLIFDQKVHWRVWILFE